MDHNPQGRRPHYNRGRRGPDRRGGDRRTPPSSQEGPARAGAEPVDVEQIMRDIRARIAQRHGIELSTQQIQELAARRLETILDPRNISPSLLDQLRRGAGAPPELAPPAAEAGFTFEDTTLYESHRGVLRFIRRLLHPILKLFFNPNPLVTALNTQARLNREAALREAQREQLQAEWNALHYELLQRVVTEVSRVSIELQAISLRIESLATRVDFNDRRVRSLENLAPQPRSAAPRPVEPLAVAPAGEAVSETPNAESATSDGNRRRRRRRRGRRGGGGAAEAGMAADGGGSALSEELTGVEPDGEDGVDEDDDGVGATAAAVSDIPVHGSEAAGEGAALEPPPPVEQPTPPRDEPVEVPAAGHSDPEPPER